MADELNVNEVQVEDDAAGIAGAAQYFQAVPLSSVDNNSTITANGRGQEAYGKAQSNIAAYGSALDQDVANIRSLNVSFKEFDNMMGQLSKNGSRVPTISAPK